MGAGPCLLFRTSAWVPVRGKTAAGNPGPPHVKAKHVMHACRPMTGSNVAVLISFSWQRHSFAKEPGAKTLQALTGMEGLKENARDFPDHPGLDPSVPPSLRSMPSTTSGPSRAPGPSLAPWQGSLGQRAGGNRRTNALSNVELTARFLAHEEQLIQH